MSSPHSSVIQTKYKQFAILDIVGYLLEASSVSLHTCNGYTASPFWITLRQPQRPDIIACLFYMITHCSSFLSSWRPMSSAPIERSPLLVCPSKCTISTPALCGSRAAARLCLYVETRSAHASLLQHKKGLCNSTYLRIRSSIAGLSFAMPPDECRPLPTMRWISESPRRRASSIDWSVYRMASLTYSPWRSISPGWLSSLFSAKNKQMLASVFDYAHDKRKEEIGKERKMMMIWFA
jgi:hypothetical protein